MALDLTPISAYFMRKGYLVKTIKQHNETLRIMATIQVPNPCVYWVYVPIIDVLKVDFVNLEIDIAFAYDTMVTYIQNHQQ